MISTELNGKPLFFCIFIFCLLLLGHHCSSQRTCPSCGSIEIPYPLSTHPNCGDPGYSLRCDSQSQKLFFDALNGSSYLVTRIMASFHRMVVQPSPWLPSKCVTQDMPVSEGLWLNQTLPFNITSSNTIFLFNCSPRLLVSPLNCTPTSLCHRYLESSGHVEAKRALQCASGLDLCCTFTAGGMPSAYKIRLHSSGCKGFRSILHLDPEKPANEWEEGLEIQWAPPPEPVCQSQPDCSGPSKCSPAGAKGLSRCLCNKGYNWDPVLGTCLRKKRNNRASVGLKVSVGVISFFTLALATAAITYRKCWRNSNQAKLMKVREDMLKSSNGGKPAKMFRLKEDDVNLAIYVSQRASDGAIMEVMDQRLLGEEPSVNMRKSVKLFSELAFVCLGEKKADRPGMKAVVQNLQCIIQIIDQENVDKEEKTSFRGMEYAQNDAEKDIGLG
ncbi:hypothetical protein QUC31_011025 [Theobroma cacao]